MDYLKKEIERIELALREPQSPERYCQLYAAQQALVWASDPGMYSPPMKTVLGGIGPIGIAEG